MQAVIGRMHLPHLSQVNNDLMLLLLNLSSSSVVPLDYLRAAGGFQLGFCLLSSEDESLRCRGADLLALLLSSPKDCKLFLKSCGFELMLEVLQRRRSSMMLVNALLQHATSALLRKAAAESRAEKEPGMLLN